MTRAHGFTTEELRGLAGDMAAIDLPMCKALVTALRRALQGYKIGRSTTKLLALQAELELAINDLEVDVTTTRPRRRPKASS